MPAIIVYKKLLTVPFLFKIASNILKIINSTFYSKIENMACLVMFNVITCKENFSDFVRFYKNIYV